MRLFKPYMLPIMGLLLLLSVTCCTSKSPAYNRENIKAMWKGEDNLIYTFDKDGKVAVAGAKNMGDGNIKWGESRGIDYVVTCCTVNITGKLSGFYNISTEYDISQQYEIINSKDSMMTMRNNYFKINDEDVVPEFPTLGMTKLSKNFSKADSLLGVWESENKRIEFLANNVLNFFTKGADGKWVIVNDADDKDTYHKYDSFLALSLFDNPVWGVEDKWSVAVFDIDFASPIEKTLIIKSKTESFTFVLQQDLPKE